MCTEREKTNKFSAFIREKTENFIYSYFFPIILTMLAMAFWVADLEAIGVGVLVIIACFILIFYEDLLPVIPLLFILPMCFRDSMKAFEANILVFGIIFSILILVIIFHFIIYPIKSPKFDLFFFMCLGVFALYLIAGLFSIYMKYFIEGLEKLLIAGTMPLVIHFLLFNSVKLKRQSDRNYKKYFCICILCAINLALSQLLFAFIHIKINGTIEFDRVIGWFCWANSAQIANLMILALPICCYMMLESKKLWLWLIQICLLYVGVCITHSDACLAIILAFLPVCIFILYKYSNVKNKNIIKKFLCFLISFVVLFAVILLVFYKTELIEFIKKASSGSGRIDAYNLAFDCFKQYPIFGVGFGGGGVLLDRLSITLWDTSAMYNGLFHSTFFQILGCSGIVGLITYVIYYIVRLRYINSASTVFGRFITISFIMFAVCGIIDNSEFNVVLLYMTTMISVSGVINKNDSSDRPLPLITKKINF